MKNLLTRLRREKGQVVLLTAFLLPVVVGFTGLAIDVGMMMVHRTERQRTADAAALAGAQRLLFKPPSESAANATTAAKQAACEYAQKNGYGNGTCNSDEVEVHIPPISGPNAGKDGFVEVIIKRTDDTFFMRVLGKTETEVKARAVGGTTPRKRNYALIVLDPTICNAFTTSSNITINGGGAIVNSTATTGGNCIGTSAAQNGGSVITAHTCRDKDGNTIDCTLDHNNQARWSVPNNATASPPPTKAPAIPDPLSCNPPGNQSAEYCPRPVPCSNAAGTTPANCVPWSPTSAGSGNKANNPTITQLSGSGEVVLEPGTYFGGLRIMSTSQTVRFKPGIYVFAGSDRNGNGGGFDYQSGNLCGIGTGCPVAEGVTFFNTGNPYANQANNRACNTFKITGSGVLRFAAPTVSHTTPLTGYKNMLFWQDDNCSAEFSFAGSGSGPWSMTGIMYFPSAHMKVTGGGNFGSVQLITKTFSQGGSQAIQINYTRYVDTDTQKYQLVE